MCFDPLPGIELKVISAAENMVDENRITVHPADLEALDVLDGDSVSLVNHGEELRAVVKSSLSIRQGQAAVPVRLRRQLNINIRDSVTIKKIIARKTRVVEKQNRNFVMGGIRAQSGLRVWVNSEDLDRLGVRNTRGLSIKQHNLNMPAFGSITLEADPALAKRVAALSADLAKKRMITIGEVFTIEVDNEI